MVEQLGNNPPFAIGQKVAALKGDPEEGVNKGDVFKVLDVHQCAACKHWFIDIGKRGYEECGWMDNCPCGASIYVKSKTVIVWYGAQNFAPIQPTFTDATKEILENFKPYEGAETWLPIKKQKEELV